MTNTQTTYDRATSAYDKNHERAPVEDNTEAIFETSRMSDCNAVVIRTGEAAEALLTVLAGSATSCNQTPRTTTMKARPGAYSKPGQTR